LNNKFERKIFTNLKPLKPLKPFVLQEM